MLVGSLVACTLFVTGIYEGHQVGADLKDAYGVITEYNEQTVTVDFTEYMNEAKYYNFRIKFTGNYSNVEFSPKECILMKI